MDETRESRSRDSAEASLEKQERLATELQKSEERWRSLTENSADHIMLLGPDMEILFINRTVPDLIKSEVIGKNLLDFVPEGSHETTVEAFQSVLHSGKTAHYTTEYRTAEGATEFFDVRLSAVLQEGEVSSVISTSHDITKRELAVQALHSLATTFSSLSGEEFFYRVAAYLSEALKTKYAFVGELMPGSDRVNVVGGVQDGQPMTLPFEYNLTGTPCEHVFKQSFCVHIQGVIGEFPDDAMLVEMGVEGYIGTPLFDRAGEPLGIIIALDDKPFPNFELAKSLMAIFADTVAAEIQRRRDEERLRRYEHIVASSTDMLALLDRNFVYLAANEAYVGVFGKVADDVIGQNAATLFGDKFFNSVIKSRGLLCMAGEDVRYQEWFDFPEGGRKYMDVLYSPYVGAANEIQGFVVTARDITTRERLQSQLAQAMKMESVGRLAGGVAHDFNNMLGVILGITEMAIERAQTDDPLLADLTEIHNVAERSAELTRQLLAFARKQTIVPQVLDLNKTMTGMLKMMRRLIGENIALSWQPGEEVWPVNMDPSQIDQILANLCANARDAIEDIGEVQIETGNASFDETFCARNPGCVAGEYVRLTVRDDGCGLDEETKSRIYEPFFTTRDLGRGTGLGLATVYGIVRQNKGLIDVVSSVGEGTTFNIYLPRYIGQVAQLPQRDTLEEARHGHGTILVVEDEDGLLKLTVSMLEHHGYKVLAAAMPSEAIRVAKAHSGEIDLLLSDVVMPEMNGLELAQQILQLSPNIKTLFMSGYTADVLADKGGMAGETHFMPKPFTMKGLVANVELALHSDLEFSRRS